MEELHPGSVHVVYASDCSVVGHADNEFGITIGWDIPMLKGYPYSILNCEKGAPLSNWGSLTGEGVKAVINKINPSAVLLTGLNYKFDLVAYLTARKSGIPVWLRCETQDYALKRSKLKEIYRLLVYSIAYRALNKIFYIGKLNKMHYIRHQISPVRLKPAYYGTKDLFIDMTAAQKNLIRARARLFAGIDLTAVVIGFSGKFIPKKNPEILFDMLAFLPTELKKRIHLYFMGSGALQPTLESKAAEAYRKYGIKTHFTGFVNQSKLVPHYLTMDVLVLPSRRMGETWGLVANEAMQAGCSVVVSDAVGCSSDFSSWERFRVFPEGDAAALAEKVTDLAKYHREFDWAKQELENYSIDATAAALLRELTITEN
ncbi:glycosyltransferase family 4 protein [Pedobacter sp. AW31-3R]|uniref:glycosyltransferase family 4 protein n=1 Tax=Pedobacter sp. AW31-3R TaxID=3445781 RepID=UPI003FA137F6